MKSLLTCLVLLLATGCTQFRSYRVNEYLEKNPSASDQQIETIKNGDVFLGMDRRMAFAAWGAPVAINRTRGSYGTREQWVYRSVWSYDVKYLYFEDGKLTTIQD